MKVGRMAPRRGGDDTGKTIQYTKTLYDPAGDIVHVKDRTNEGHARPFVLQAAMMSGDAHSLASGLQLWLATKCCLRSSEFVVHLQLYYYKARFYSRALGRFLQTDPIGSADDLNLYAYVKNNPINFTDPTGMIAASDFASPTSYPSTASANVPVQTAASAPKLVAPTFSMPATAAGNQAAVQVAARGVTMTGNPPGGFRLNLNGLDTDYFDDAGNLTAQYHESHGEAHGHNFFDGKRDPTHLPMSPIPRR